MKSHVIFDLLSSKLLYQSIFIEIYVIYHGVIHLITFLLIRSLRLRQTSSQSKDDVDLTRKGSQKQRPKLTKRYLALLPEFQNF